jgi:hypothetical protein
VATDLLEIEHDAGEFWGVHFGAFAELAGLEILAENAAEIAPAKENRAGAVPTAETIFFAEVRKSAGDTCQSSAFANSDLVIESVDLAVTRANAT